MPEFDSKRITRDAVMDFAKTFPFFNLLGIEIVDMQPGLSVTRVTWREDLCQPAGILHGGIMASLIDTGIAHAIMLADEHQEHAAQGGRLVSVDLRIKYIRPVSDGVVTCRATIPRFGRQIVHGEAVVTNEEGKEVARGDSIYMAVAGHRVERLS